MILRSIRLQNWRCFIDEITVGPFSERLNVIHAPNATGKSTLFEALRRGILDSHRVGGREVEAIRPWGRVLAPYVSVEFSHGGAVYRITKRFLDNPLSVLEREENGRLVRLAEGPPADEKIRSIFTKNPPGRGFSRFENWGLAQILWAPQGDLSFAKLSGDVLEDIRNFLGAQVRGAGSGAVEQRIEQEYLKFFTPTGKWRSGKDAPKLVSLKDRLEDAHKRLVDAKALQLAYEELVQKVEELRAKRSLAKHEAETVFKELDKARASAEKYKELIHTEKEQQSQLAAAEAKFNELNQLIETIKNTKKEMEDVEKEILETEKNLPAKHDRLKMLKTEEIEARRNLENARREQEKIDRLNEVAERARFFVENTKKQVEIERRLKKVKELNETLEALKKEKARLIAPNSRALKNIRKALSDLENAQIHINASLISLDIVPEKNLSAKVLLGETPGKLEVEAGETIEIKGSPEVLVEVNGFGIIRASGPVASIEEYRKKKARAEQKLRKLTEPFETDDLNILEDLHEKLQILTQKYVKIETELKTLLEGKSIADLENELFQIKHAAEKILAKHPQWANKLPDVLKLEKEARDAKRIYRERVQQAEANWQKLQIALAAAERDVTLMEESLEVLKKRHRLLKSKLDKLTDDGRDNETRNRELKNLALEWKAAETLLEETKKQLNAFPEDPQLTVDRLEKRLQELDKVATEALEQEKSAEGNLEQLSTQGTYSNLALIEEEVAELSREIEAEEVRMLSIRLLYETLTQCCSKALATVIEPVERLATRILRRIAGGKLGHLKVGKAFEPMHVVPEVAESTVTLENVSGGEREQIYLATRLALAEVIAKEERQLVVLDDVLTFTDAGRLARVMNILEEAADRLQILILTCHPERYLGLEDTNFIDLEKIVHN